MRRSLFSSRAPAAYAGAPVEPHIRARQARLSRRFYDVFGEEIANELVDCFNAVDSTYRGDLRALNEGSSWTPSSIGVSPS